MESSLQLVGAVLILAAFVAAQAGRASTTSVTYLLANALGAGLLFASASIDRQWGFMLLEGVWALVALASLSQLARGAADHVATTDDLRPEGTTACRACGRVLETDRPFRSVGERTRLDRCNDGT